MNLRYAEKNPDRLDYLGKRRSTPIKLLGGAGPSAEQVETLIATAARVPDHGKLNPWYFIVIQGDAAKKLGEESAKIYARQNPDISPDMLSKVLEVEQARFLRAPVIIAVISRPRLGKIHAWEQVLSAGAVCHQLGLAANAMGFGSAWVTEWVTYDTEFRAVLGCDPRDQIAGFMYIGTPSAAPEERPRADPKTLTNYYGQPITNKGDVYDKS